MATVRHIGLFPFCAGVANSSNDTKTGPYTFYPIELPVKTLLAWYWKVKKWKMEIRFNEPTQPNQILYSGTKYYDSHAITDFSSSVSGVANSEKDLVCFEPTALEDADGGIDQWTFGLFTKIPGNEGKAILTKDGNIDPNGTAWPQMYFGVNYISAGFATFDYFGLSEDDFPRVTDTQNNGVRVDGINIPTFANNKGQAIFTPHEYWQYQA